jgi:uroporphyrinogen-III synthase
MPQKLVVITRDEGQGAPLSARLAAHGLVVFPLPTISIEPPPDVRPLDEALAGLSRYDWLAFTSAHAVESVCRRPAWPAAWRAAPRPRVAVVGAATAAALEAHGVRTDLCPPEGGALALAAALLSTAAGRPLRVLWPRSDIARPELRVALEAAGVGVVDPVAYRTGAGTPAQIGEFRRLLEGGEVAAVCFLSPSSANNLAAALGRTDLRPLAGRTSVVSIGPTTSAALHSLGAPPDLEAGERSGQGLAEALIAHLLPREGVAP